LNAAWVSDDVGCQGPMSVEVHRTPRQASGDGRWRANGSRGAVFSMFGSVSGRSQRNKPWRGVMSVISPTRRAATERRGPFVHCEPSHRRSGRELSPRSEYGPAGSAGGEVSDMERQPNDFLPSLSRLHGQLSTCSPGYNSLFSVRFRPVTCGTAADVFADAT
jgi:hypothetical protein